MSFLTFGFNQTITHWAFNGVDSAGDQSFATPVTLTGRWEEKNEIGIGADGEEFTSNAVLFLPSDIPVNDYVFLGTSVVSDPVTLINAFKVKSFSKIPTMDATDFERKAMI